jgi:uncharacterized protein with HEPN domain
MRDDRQRLLDVQEAIERIERRAPRSRASFEGNDLLQVWIVYHLQIIGEAVRSLSEDLREAHPDVPWRQIIGMRNILVHRYFGIDAAAVWSVVERDLPQLRAAVDAMLGEL